MIEVELPDGRVVTVETDDPAAAAEAAKRFMDRGAAPAAPAAAETAPPEERGTLENIGRGLRVGAQGLGEAAGNILGIPGDLTRLAGEASDALKLNLSGALFGEEGRERARQQLAAQPSLNPLPTSEDLQVSFGNLLRDAFGEDVLLREEEMSPMERIGKSINALGGEALAGSTGSIRTAGTGLGQAAETGLSRVLAPPAVREAAAEGAAGRVFAGDVAAGAGAGAGLGAFQETNAPEVLQQAFGPAGEAIGNLAAVLAGGVTGNLAARGGGALTGAGRPPERPVTNVRTGDEFSTAVKDAAAFISQQAADAPGSAAATARARADELLTGDEFIRPSELPTVGMLAGDQGLAALEKAARTVDEVPFRRRDAARTERVRQLVEDTAPPGDGRAFTEEFERRATQRRGEAGQAVSEAQTAEETLAAQRRAAGEELTAEAAGGPEAARQIDEVVTEATREAVAEKNRRFDAAATDVQRDPSFLARAADEELAGVTAGANAADEVPVDFINRAKALAKSGKPVTVADLQARRAELAQIEREARTAGKFRLVDSARRMKQAIADDFQRLADEGNADAQEALRFFKEDFGPTFARGPGDPATEFRSRLSQDPATRTTTPPSRTAPTFIRAGDPEAAASFARVLEQSPRSAEGRAAARTFILSNLASRGVIDAKTGAVNRVKLGKFREKFGDDTIENAAPGLVDELDRIGSRAGADEELAARLKSETAAAVENARITEADIKTGALGFALGRSPEKAVARVFGSDDPARNMANVVKEIGDDAAARDGLKQAVREFLLDTATNAEGGVGDGRPISAAKMSNLFERHADTLAEAYEPKEMNNLRQVHQLLKDEQIVKAAKGIPGADTTPRAEALKKAERALEATLKVKFGVLKGGGIMRALKIGRESLPGNDFKEQTQQLLTQMFLDPELAAHLLTREIKDAPKWNARLQRLIGVSESVREAGDETAEE